MNKYRFDIVFSWFQTGQGAFPMLLNRPLPGFDRTKALCKTPRSGVSRRFQSQNYPRKNFPVTVHVPVEIKRNFGVILIRPGPKFCSTDRSQFIASPGQGAGFIGGESTVSDIGRIMKSL